MREIISIEIGECGNKMGNKLWEFILEEHGVNGEGEYFGNLGIQLERIDKYFDLQGEKYIPRSLLVDFDTSAIDLIHTGNTKNIFPNYYAANIQNESNNWLSAFYVDGPRHLDIVMEKLRDLAESCDSLQGFQKIHSVTGCTGGGFGSLLNEKIKEEFPKQSNGSFAIFPEIEQNNSLKSEWDTINSILSIQHLIEFTDDVIVIENVSLRKILQRNFSIESPNMAAMNHIACQGLSGATAHLRFHSSRSHSSTNASFSSLNLSLLTFPRLHFYALSHCPYTLPHITRQKPNLPVSTRIQQIFNPNNFLADINPADTLTSLGKYFAGQILTNLRGTEEEPVIQDISIISPYFPPKYIEWMPDPVKYNFGEIGIAGLEGGTTLLANTFAIKITFLRLSEGIGRIFQKYKDRVNRKYYILDNQDEHMTEIRDAESNLMDEICEYQSYSDSTAEEEFYEEQEYMPNNTNINISQSMFKMM